MLSPLYLAEISPPELRGSLMALEQFAIVLGVVMGFWAGFFTRGCMSPIILCSFHHRLTTLFHRIIITSYVKVTGSSSWRTPLAIQLIPGILLAVGCLILPPSPRLLVLHGRFDEALAVLGRLRGRPVGGIGLSGEQNVDVLVQVCIQLITLSFL